ncbi:MAG: glycoside hydrolase [Saprospiraceae bacterium]|nr:glycoside hydrolase [Saprospiraceae bacterium]
MQKLLFSVYLPVTVFLLVGCKQNTLSENLVDAFQTDKKDSIHSSKEVAPLRIIGFYHGEGEDIGKYKVEKLTHIVFCFTILKGHKIGFRKDQDKRTLEKLCALKKTYPNLKVIVSFGGWGGCYSCSNVFARELYRKRFAESVKDLLIEYGADGFDLDWESPVIGGPPDHSVSKDDRDNFTELIKELRNALPTEMELSFDANTFKSYVEKSIKWDSVMQYVDYVNLMTYSLPLNDPNRTGHHTALFSSTAQIESMDMGLQRLDSLGIPKDKLIIGAAFYGEMVETVDTINHGLGRKGKFIAHITYQEISNTVLKNSNYDYHWDSTSQAPYLYDPTSRRFITFDDRKSVTLKTKYAVENKLGGIMFWKLNADNYNNGLLDAIYDASGKTLEK